MTSGSCHFGFTCAAHWCTARAARDSHGCARSGRRHPKSFVRTGRSCVIVEFCPSLRCFRIVVYVFLCLPQVDRLGQLLLDVHRRGQVLVVVYVLLSNCVDKFFSMCEKVEGAVRHKFSCSCHWSHCHIDRRCAARASTRPIKFNYC